MTKKSPAEIQKYLQTHCPNRKERRILEARYKKQQRDIKKGKIKPQKTTIKRSTWWSRLINFLLRK